MPTIEVNGDFADALVLFKRRVQQEGIVGEYKRRQAYTPPHEIKAQKAFRAKCKRRERQERRKGN